MENERFTDFNKVALRSGGVYLDTDGAVVDYQPNVMLVYVVGKLAECGFTLSEPLLHALALQPEEVLDTILAGIYETTGTHLNWSPLVKGWDKPTKETRMDHLITAVFNVPALKGVVDGTTLPCGHFIPDGTFPLQRYNGCPFCGKPFILTRGTYKGQGSRLKELRLIDTDGMTQIFRQLIESPVPLDATQRDSFALLLKHLPLPEGVQITIKENSVLILSCLVEAGRGEEAIRFLKTPHDILRFLWYRHTGQVQVVRPKTMRMNISKWEGIFRDVSDEWSLDNLHYSRKTKKELLEEHLKLKYSRSECRMVARWMNALPMQPERMAEVMHPYRGMWVRFIRALRLAEFAHKPGFGQLATLMDIFYRQDYTPWSGLFYQAVDQRDAETALQLLAARPGEFARRLFSMMLRFGSDTVLDAFRRVTPKLPVRLVLSLGNAADDYFLTLRPRLAKTVGGSTHTFSPNRLLYRHSDIQLEEMARSIKDLFLEVMHEHFAKAPHESQTAYIDPQLFDIPVAVGDRATTVQDLSCALQGMRFPVEGNRVRLFMQWGEGMPAQHLDMDLSCTIVYPDRGPEQCAYYNLTATGAKHSGDIRDIPDRVGTAEYVDLNLKQLRAAGAKHVIFHCNAYSSGALSLSLRVGWMNSKFPMKVSNKTGVAYDPSCVQHMVRVAADNLSKGLVFGVLDVDAREITWLEMPNQNQIGGMASTSDVETLLRRLRAKCSVGQLLETKIEAQGLQRVDTPEEADEAYTYEWALRPESVSELLG